jgi:hypothetical protein
VLAITIRPDVEVVTDVYRQTPENGWVGRELALGGGVLLNVALLDPRCVMTTLAQEDLPQDTESSGRWCATTAWNCRA